jgi:ribosomal protein L7Ae-like RNA K-turn-binding protein
VRFLSLLGIAQAAGRLVSGDAACEEALERNRVYLLVLANDASDNVKRRFLTRAARRGVPFVQMATKEYSGQGDRQTWSGCHCYLRPCPRQRRCRSAAESD